jgi:hypothetical protein
MEGTGVFKMNMFILNIQCPTMRRQKARGAHRRKSPTNRRKHLMGDEFETDTETPTEADLDTAYGSKFLSATDVGTRKIRTKIAKVRKEDLRGKDDKKKTRFVLYLEALDKPLVLNATNKEELVKALGKTPANWIGASIGIFVDPDVKFAGVRTGGVRLRVLTPAATAKPAAKPAAKPTATPPAPEQDDPGFDPDLNDATPDFSAAG